MTIYAALLRGINVGGHNKIKMAELREVLTEAGLARVQTYIQSGNILFESEQDEAALSRQIEQLIETGFGLSIKVIIRSAAELREIAAGCPFPDSQIAEKQALSESECLYVAMLREPPSAERMDRLKSFDLKDDVYSLQGRDLYLLYGNSIRNSKLSTEVEKLGVPTTVRNWKTLNKLVELTGAMENGGGA